MKRPTQDKATPLSAVISLLLVLGCSSSDDESPEAPVIEDAGNEPDSGRTTQDSSTETPQDAGENPDAPVVTVTGPITGGMGKPFTSSIVDLSTHGYSETELFFEGDATAYAVQGEMTEDGKWQLMETTQAPFKSRMIVRRPIDATDFNGTVVVEWLNVSAGADGDPGFMYNYKEILREGYAWVGVSAQAAGIQAGGVSLSPNAMPLKEYDPERYGSLVHPGDAYSFDIYTRAAEIIRGAGDLDVLDGLVPERVISYGESQSAMRLVSYVDGVHPLVKAYDAFFIHSRSGSGLPFGNDAGFALGGGTPARIRDDIAEPVLQFQTETDVLGTLGFLAARQPDTDRLRTWEVAGTAHADTYLTELAQGGIACEGANDGPQHFVLKAALHAVDAWLRDGTAPAIGAPLMTDDSDGPLKDEHGNTMGGIRTPDVDVPISTLSGNPAGTGGDFFCFLFGSSVPFEADKLAELYPTHEDYVAKVRDAAQAAREAGFLLEPEEQAMVAEAEAAPVPE